MNDIPPPGPERDRLIAEKLGWKWFECIRIACLVPPHWVAMWEQAPSLYKPLPNGPGKLERDYLDGIHFYDSSKGGNQHPEIPNWSTNDALAFVEIWEPFCDSHPEARLGRSLFGKAKRYIVYDGTAGNSFHFEGVTNADAITQAFLEAK